MAGGAYFGRRAAIAGRRPPFPIALKWLEIRCRWFARVKKQKGAQRNSPQHCQDRDEKGTVWLDEQEFHSVRAGRQINPAHDKVSAQQRRRLAVYQDMPV